MKRGIYSLVLLLTLPTFASAFNCWSVSRSTSPTSQAGTLVPPADSVGYGYKTTGSVTYVTAATGAACATAPATIDFTLTPPAGAVPTVKVDGAAAAVPAAGPAATVYTVSKGSRISHTINATYQATATKVTITTTPAAGGYIEPTQTVAYNGGTDITVTANGGYTVTEVKINGTASPAALAQVLADGFYTFANVTTAQTLTATFAQTPTLSAAIATGNATIEPGATLNLVGSAVKNMSTIVPTYQWSAVPAGATFGSPTAATSTFSAPAGTYTVTLTVAAPGLTADADDSKSITIIAQSTNPCLGCHSTRDAALVTAFNGSTHKTQSISCADCHNQTGAASHPFDPAAAFTSCASCHNSVAGHSATANSCGQCHDSHSTSKVHAAAASLPDCASCHETVAANFATSQHGTRQGKATWYNDNLGNPAANELQKGFGNYVNIDYAALPCGKCHNAAAWTPAGGTDQWLATTGGVMVCNDCHGNKAAGIDTTAVNAPVSKTTCFGCHSRQANETAAGLTDVHFAAGMGCSSCHSTSDMHGTGTQAASQLAWGTISAQCENCHGEGKSRGPISTIAAHVQHAGNIACSTCHAESMITCHNCHFDNEAGAGGATKAKFFSGRFGGTVASGNSWRFLVNRVMPDGSTKIYPGSMQSLVADYTVDNVDGAQIHTHAGIAPYYSHTITRVNALTCDKCHGTETAVKLAAGQPVRVTTWNAAANVPVAYTAVQATFIGPKGVIPVPENPKGKLLMDFVDLTNPGASLTADKKNSTSDRILLQKDGPDTIHMPEAFVKPLTAMQMKSLSMPYREGATTSSTAHAEGFIGTNQLTEHTSCGTCHTGVANAFSTSQHGTRQGKATWYNDNLNNPAAVELQKGFGNYVNVDYAALPCGKCHAAAAWTVSGTDQWAASTGGQSVCTDCHGNKAAGTDTTAVYAPVTAATCKGCHSRQANETAAGLTDVHLTAGMGCPSCHSTTDMHGTGTQTASQLQWGTISAQCENCHGSGKSQGPISTIAAHVQHGNDIACSTCHAESMITCHNCHFDNEAGAGGAAKAKFFSGRFGGTAASGNSWRFLVNRVMPDGSTKIYPGSMQSLVADYTVDNTNDGVGHTHAGIAPYYSHAITRVNALSCDKCHGTETAVKLAAGESVRVTTWNAAAGVPVPAANVTATFVGPKGVIPVPENPRGKLLMDFVDLTDPTLGTSSPRILFQKDGPDTIHMPEAFVKPLTAAQMQKLANVQFDHTSAVATTSQPVTGFTVSSCQGCHQSTNTVFAKSLHYTREGKATFYNATSSTKPIEVGFGKFVTVGYSALPCADCHNAAAWNAGSGDTWAAETGGNPVCTDCHTNKVAGAATTAFDAPVTKATCIGCHSRQANETSMGLTDVHMSGTVINGQTMNYTCSTCHPFSDLHGDGTAKASQLAPGAVTANCDNCHTSFVNSIPEHTQHMANIACSTCHMESVITCYGCHFDNEASDPADSSILHAKFASGKFGGTAASGKSWRFLVNRVMADGSTKVYPASMQSLVADRTAANAPGEDNAGWTHAAIAPYYSHSITKVNALKCDKCHGIQKAIDLNNGTPVRVVKWNAAAGVEIPVGSMMATYTAPSGVIPVPENPVGKLLMDFVDLVNPAAALNASGTSISNRLLFKADGPDTIHMPEAYVKPMTAAQIQKLAIPQVRP